MIVPDIGSDPKQLASGVAVQRNPRRRGDEARGYLLEQLGSQLVIPAARAEKIAERRRVFREQILDNDIADWGRHGYLRVRLDRQIILQTGFVAICGILRATLKNPLKSLDPRGLVARRGFSLETGSSKLEATSHLRRLRTFFWS